MRWCWRALSAASVAAVLLVALAMLLFTPGQAIADQSATVWHPQPGDPAALSRIYDANQSAMRTAGPPYSHWVGPVSYTHLRAHETRHDLVCRLLLEKKK